MSPLVLSLIKTAIIPAVFAAGLWMILSIVVPRRFVVFVQGAIFSILFWVGCYVLLSRFSIPPHDVNESLMTVSLLLFFYPLVASKNSNSGIFVRGLFVALTGLIVLWHLRASLSETVHLRNMAAFFFLTLGFWSMFEKADRLVNPSTLLLMPLISLVSLSIMLLLSGSASLSNMITIVCALLGAGFAISLVFPSRIQTQALIPFCAVMPIAFMVAGHFYLDMNPWTLIYLCAPQFLLWLRSFFSFRIENRFQELAFMTVLAVIPVGYVVYSTFKTSGPLY